jgi:hypothetical protein
MWQIWAKLVRIMNAAARLWYGRTEFQTQGKLEREKI